MLWQDTQCLAIQLYTVHTPVYHLESKEAFQWTRFQVVFGQECILWSSLYDLFHLRAHSAQFSIEFCQKAPNWRKEEDIHAWKSNVGMELLGKLVAAKEHPRLGYTCKELESHILTFWENKWKLSPEQEVAHWILWGNWNQDYPKRIRKRRYHRFAILLQDVSSLLCAGSSSHSHDSARRPSPIWAARQITKDDFVKNDQDNFQTRICNWRTSNVFTDNSLWFS